LRFHLAPAGDRAISSQPLKVVECRLRTSALDGDLRHLLRLCGIEPGSGTVGPSARTSFGFASRTPAHADGAVPSWWALRQPKPLARETSLSAFLGKHATAARAARIAMREGAAAIDALVDEMRAKFGLRVDMRDRLLPAASTRMLSDLREQISGGSAAHRDALRGMHVAVCAHSDVGVDEWGTLLISPQVVHRKSLQLLVDVIDPGQVRAGRERAASVDVLERGAADALHLRSVRAADGVLRGHSRYWSFLVELARAGATHAGRSHLDAWAQAAASDAVAASRMPMEDGSAQRRTSLWTAVIERSAALEEAHTLRAHNSMRTLHVPMHCSAHSTAQFLGGPGALAATQMAMRGQVLEQARRQIGAAHVGVDASLTDAQVFSACSRLSGYEPRAVARTMCADLMLHLSLSFSSEANGIIKIRHDFED
jgi:hypothetical protein